MRKLGNHVRGCRCDQQAVDGLCDGDVLDGGVEIGLLGRRAEHAGDDLLAGKSGEGEGADKLLRRGGHDDLHARSAILQLANDFGGFVGGDAAGDTQGDLHLAFSIAPSRVEQLGRELEVRWSSIRSKFKH